MKRKRKRRHGTWLLIIIIAIFAYGWYTGINSPEVTEYNLVFENLPQGFDGCKIVQLSDLHGSEFGENNCRLIELVQGESPDLIAITGDIITDEDDLPAVERLLPQLTAIAPVYFISGNHDYGSGVMPQLNRILEDNGVHFLQNEYEYFSRNGERIVVAGVEDPNSWADMIAPDEFMSNTAGETPGVFRLFLAHRNTWIENYPELPADLILCGHTHGGIIRLPGVGGIISTERKLFPEYDAGLFSSGSYEMIVSRGLGNSVSIPRLFNRPEVVSISLYCS